MANPCECLWVNKGIGYSCIAILFILGLGCILQLFFVAPAVDDAFQDGVNDMIIMTQAQQDDMTDDYKAWISNYGEDEPLQLFEYWIYNITNPYDVPDGVDPIFDLIGPFVFRRYENRTNVIFYEDEEEYQDFGDDPIVEFEYIYEFEYLEDESTPDISLDDIVWTMSGAMQGLFGNINGGLGSIIPDCVFQALSEWPGEAVFYNGPISGLVYGFRDPYVEDALNEACAGDFLWPVIAPNTFFSLLPDGNNKVYQHTGKNDPSRVAELVQFRNFTEPPVNSWKLGGGLLWCDPQNPNQPCHTELVAGSRETRQFAPDNRITEDSELVVWSIEKFRKTNYVYQRDVTFGGVDLMRFKLDSKELRGCIYEYNTACSDEPTPSPSNPPTPNTDPPTMTAPPTAPSAEPTTANPTPSPTTAEPTLEPTEAPTSDPTLEPTTSEPTATFNPSTSPTTANPTPSPTTAEPTEAPTFDPTLEPTQTTLEPTSQPSQAPTCAYLIGESHTCKYFQYWQDEDGNPVDGVANLTNLRGSPSFMSKGRFFNADYFIENVINRFEGLEEGNQEDDDQYFDVDPRTGIVFRNFHNYQMNFEFYPLNIPENKQPLAVNHSFSDFGIVGTLMPFTLVRVEAVATDDQMADYKEILDQIDLIKGFSLYGGPALAVVFFGLMFFILCKMKKSAGRGDLDYGRLVEHNGNNNNTSPQTSGIPITDISMQKAEAYPEYSTTKTVTKSTTKIDSGNGNGYGTMK